MRRAIALIICLLLPVVTLSSIPRGIQSEAKLVHRCEEGCSSYDSIMERTLDLAQNRAVPIDTVAVRVCSKEPMPLALSIAAMNPFKVAKWVNDVYNYSPERIVFLRSEDCLGTDPKVAATELWAVPKGAALPASVESVRSAQVQSEYIGAERARAKGVRNYQAATNELIAKLRARPEAVGIVLGYYHNQPGFIIKRRLREVCRRLGQSRLPQNRYFVRLMPWTGESSVDPPEPEPKYPSLFVVEVIKTKDGSRRAESFCDG